LSKDPEKFIKENAKVKHKDNFSVDDITLGTRIGTSHSIKNNIKKEERGVLGNYADTPSVALLVSLMLSFMFLYFLLKNCVLCNMYLAHA
jgi:hypothetical protein